jgi:hypothetical protein
MVTAGSGLSDGSPLWRLFFRLFYRFLRLVDPLIRIYWRARLPGLARVVDLETIGRRSGRPRHRLVTLLSGDGHRYVGHPNGSAVWTKNLEATGEALVRDPTGAPTTVRAVRLEAGSERNAVLRSAWSQQPFPANLVYWLARNHVRAVGIYFRLEDRLSRPLTVARPST